MNYKERKNKINEFKEMSKKLKTPPKYLAALNEKKFVRGYN